MDISKLNTSSPSDDGYSFTLTHPDTGAPMDIEISVLGSDSDAYRTFVRRQVNKARKAAERSRRLMLSTVEQAENDEVELYAAVTIGWKNLEVGGQALAFNLENVRRIYADRGYRWLFEQVKAAVEDRSNFLPKTASA